jgi:clan AA aspartic protease
MDLIYSDLSLANLRKPELKPMQVRALADSCALHLRIPKHIVIPLDLEELCTREVTTADGSQHLCPYVGPIQLKFENKGCFASALVLGNEVLLGAVPMVDMDVLLSPAKQAGIVNPESPNISTSIAKGLRQVGLATPFRCPTFLA